ncbi:MAG: glycosyltransferase [Halodesulfovibrio sp.]
MKVAIYRHQLFAASEPFITTQASNIPGFSPLYVGTELSGPIPDGTTCFATTNCRIQQRVTRHNPAAVAWLDAQRPALMHAHFGIDAVYALPIAKQLGIPLVTTFHGIDATASTKTLLTSKKIAWLTYLLRRSELKRDGALFLCVSEFIKKRVLDLGFPAQRTTTLYTGIDPSKFTRNTPYTNTGPILHIARLVEKKGTEDVLQAFAKLPRQLAPSLVIIGDGPLKQKLHDLAQNLGISKQVSFIPFCSQQEIQQWLSKAALLCAPSKTARNGDSEGLGQVVLEAQAMEIPVIATHHAAFNEAILDGATGILVPESAPDLLAEAMKALLSDPTKAAAMGREGKKHILSCFDARKQGEKLAELYLKTLS